MKDELTECLRRAFAALARANETLPERALAGINVEASKDPAHGDYVSNAALRLASPLGLAPRELASRVVPAVEALAGVARVEVAGPGFINVFLDSAAGLAVVDEVLDAGDAYGRRPVDSGARVQVEFVSANPTGPLHVGHGRGAAYGDALARLLKAAGHAVTTEYYVNDAGRQMAILALSVWLRWLEARGHPPGFPEQGYRGEYVRGIADTLDLPAGPPPPELAAALREPDPEAALDAAIRVMREALGETGFATVRAHACDVVLAGIRHDLDVFRVAYDSWFSERSLVDAGAVGRAVAALEAAAATYRDGALWFAATRFGDDKDRVLVRENGEPTYFAADVAYHLDKFERGFEQVINIWGSDHHGYVPRVRAALTALGIDAARLEVNLVQFATLYRGSERLQMSTRSGEFVTLAELVAEVGADAARFFYVMRRAEQHLDFDLELATSQSNENPVYYIQYAHARICSVRRQLEGRGLAWDRAAGSANLDRLATDHEQALLTQLKRWPETVERAAAAREPHQVVGYLRELANQFHSYYNAHKLILDDPALRDARLSLAFAVAQVLRNGSGILGIDSPEEM